MLSRVADNIYWMQRYRERAENTARLIDVSLHLSVDTPSDSESQWDPIVQTTGHYHLYEKLYGKSTDENAMEFLTFNLDNPHSILSCLIKARENARACRDVITSEMWQELNTTYLFVKKSSTIRAALEAPYDYYNRIKRQCQLFTGIADTTMSHSEAWHFGRVGYLLERADMTSRILDVKYFILLPSPEHVGTAYDDLQWSALLKSANGFEMYRKIWNQIHHAHVVEFLIQDAHFPRSILSCLIRAEQSLHAISGSPLGDFSNLPEKTIGQLRAKLSCITGGEIIQNGLHEFLNDIQLNLMHINDNIYDTFFALRPMQSQTTQGINL